MKLAGCSSSTTWEPLGKDTWSGILKKPVQHDVCQVPYESLSLCTSAKTVNVFHSRTNSLRIWPSRNPLGLEPQLSGLGVTVTEDPCSRKLSGLLI